MRFYPFTPLVCVLLILTGCQQSPQSLVIDEKDDIQTIRTAKSVTAYWLATNREYRPSVDDYEIENGPHDFPAERTDQLREILLTLRSDPLSAKKACIPDFRVRFRLQDELHSVDILLCLDCRIMAIYRDSKAYTCADIDKAAASKLIAITKELFRDDPAIQALF